MQTSTHSPHAHDPFHPHPTPPPPTPRPQKTPVGSLIATLVVVPIQEAKGYGLGFGIPTAVMGLAILLLLLGAALRLYTYVPPEGSPLYRIWRVLAAAFRNRRLQLPISPDELYGGERRGEGGWALGPPLHRLALAKGV
jgi:hypothetical protein